MGLGNQLESALPVKYARNLILRLMNKPIFLNSRGCLSDERFFVLLKLHQIDFW
jgi:hypothetical protein